MAWAGKPGKPVAIQTQMPVGIVANSQINTLHGQSVISASVTAVLGPTNTGKTHLALERMLGHASGMIGLPLRLLAREIFDRILELRPTARVALITGEERIIPKNADYFVCTVEAMPLSRTVDFLAVDEIQLCADPERGHVFTDRLLHARGRQETMFMGAETIQPLIRSLIPNLQFINRPRFSELTWQGNKKVSRLPRRSAIVAFSADEVYAIAELIRRQRGGAAVVMGALSPRTRNAQVELYQNGDVDFIVATDAIGMGLNMDVDHVAFASLVKFDGRRHRELTPSELAQIAGRAGRHMNDGTFGATADAGALEPEIIGQIERHEFRPLKVLQWRNSDLNFGSLGRLLADLERRTDVKGLSRAREADDLKALRMLASDPEVKDIASSPDMIRLLWDVAQVPDFPKSLVGEHVSLLGKIYRYLSSGNGKLPSDWVNGYVERLNKTDGDIDTLASRLSHIRTWTYLSHRSGWIEESEHWQDRTRRIEDTLSDSLHEKLTQRFIDRRTSVLLKRLKQKEELLASVTQEGEVLVEGEFIGRLQGFSFVPDPQAVGVHGKALRSVAGQALTGELTARASKLADADAGAIDVNEKGQLLWQEVPVATLTKGATALQPSVRIDVDELVSPADREKIQKRLDDWLRLHLNKHLEPLIKLRDSELLTGLARGLAFQLVEALGATDRANVADDIRALDQDSRVPLRKLGVRFGEMSIFLPALLKPAPAKLTLMLWGVFNEISDIPAAPPAGLCSVPMDRSTPRGYYDAAGFRVCGLRAVRIDMLERLADMLRPLNNAGQFEIHPDLMSVVGCSGEDFHSILRAMGYRAREVSRADADRILEENAARLAKAESREAVQAVAEETAAVSVSSDENAENDASTVMEDESSVDSVGSVSETKNSPEAASSSSPEDASTVPAPDLASKSVEANSETSTAEAEKTEESEIANADEPETVLLWRRRRPPTEQGRRGGHKGSKSHHKGKSDGGGKSDGKSHFKAKGKKPGSKGKAAPRNYSSGPTDKGKKVDPDSPFAALGALKDQLKKG